MRVRTLAIKGHKRQEQQCYLAPFLEGARYIIVTVEVLMVHNAAAIPRSNSLISGPLPPFCGRLFCSLRGGMESRRSDQLGRARSAAPPACPEATPLAIGKQASCRIGKCAVGQWSVARAEPCPVKQMRVPSPELLVSPSLVFISDHELKISFIYPSPFAPSQTQPAAVTLSLSFTWPD